MSRSVIVTFTAVCLFVQSSFADDSAAPAVAAEGSIALFNGRDLTGWEVKDGKREAWVADGELLSCVSGGGGWLRTSRMYDDFVIKLEYRIPKFETMTEFRRTDDSNGNHPNRIS